MKLLELYILRRTVQMFLTALVPVLAIIWTTQVLARINLVTDSGQSVGSFMLLATFILPTIIPAVLPFALVIGITQTLTAMNNDSELAVIDAAGAPRHTILRPVLALAAGMAVVSLLMTNFVEPKLRVGVREMIAAAYADLLSTVIEEKSFRRIEDGLYVQISERLSGRVLKGLFVADSRDPASELIYYAREGAVDEGGAALVMKDGEVQRKSPNGEVSIVRFDSYSFDLSDFSQSRGQARLHAGDRDLGFLLNPDQNDPDVQRNLKDYRSELHRRLSTWTFPFVFALISLVICSDARSHREARLHPMAIALTLSLALFWLSNYTVELAGNSLAFVPLAYLVPLGSGLIAAIMLIRRRHPHKTSVVTTFLADRLSAILRRFTPKSDATGGGTT